MSRRTFRPFLLAAAPAAATALFTSCTVDQEAGLFRPASPGAAIHHSLQAELRPDGDEPPAATWAERRREAREARQQRRLEAAELREREREARHAAAEAAERLEAEREAARPGQRNRFGWQTEPEPAPLSRFGERQARAADRLEMEAAAGDYREVDSPPRRQRGGLFSFFGGGQNHGHRYRSEGHHIYVNEHLLDSLTPANSRIEISLGEQLARVFMGDGRQRQVVIETQISTGRPGYSTPTGQFRVQEKSVQKRSTLYGTWLDSSGAVVTDQGDSRRRPRGAARFVGADMPYWIRINGGIGLHIGYVPNYPASHGCIRVPESVQPLIYSKVRVGTPVTVRH